ncbi:2Fe-2S ferredoxin [Tepidibacillus fermentans]|uniref:2Fe-2S ferredoxin n=1 Tax=Tepidibacillus fermentans TaxID=1281767 RepID=A0A4R3KK12_9BACI|nr:2Fe-2S iron-sulfur cluster-binding protein [Tepidibacillus fermentans]TCS84131.1 2Fe-2S ferredoxin [Tepidibacillus fermentans]
MSETIIFFHDYKKIEIKPGITILKAAIRANVHLAHKCGGRGACLTCKVKVDDPTAVSPPTNSERQKLGSALLQQGMRLGCQAKIIKSLKVEIPEDPLKAVIRKQLAKQKEDQENF